MAPPHQKTCPVSGPVAPARLGGVKVTFRRQNSPPKIISLSKHVGKNFIFRNGFFPTTIQFQNSEVRNSLKMRKLYYFESKFWLFESNLCSWKKNYFKVTRLKENCSLVFELLVVFGAILVSKRTLWQTNSSSDWVPLRHRNRSSRDGWAWSARIKSVFSFIWNGGYCVSLGSNIPLF